MKRANKTYQKGASITEYAILVAAIAITLVATIIIYQQGLSGKFSETKECLESLPAGGQDCAKKPN